MSGRKKNLIIGVLVLVLVCILYLGAKDLLGFKKQQKQVVVDDYQPLDFCQAETTGVCVASFGRGSLGQFFVNLKNVSTLPDNFEVAIDAGNGFSKYPCQMLDEFPDSATCTGLGVPIGSTVKIGIVGGTPSGVLTMGSFEILDLTMSATQTPVSGASASQPGSSSYPSSQPTAQPTSHPNYPNYP